MGKNSLGMRMTPEQYFKFHGEPSPPLFYDVPAKPIHGQKAIKGVFKGYVVGETPGFPTPIHPTRQVDHTALVVGVVALVAVVGLVVLGLAFLSRKG